MRELDPDVLTGWNVVDFDMVVLDRIARAERVSLRLGRGTEALTLRPMAGARDARQASVPGRVVLDGIRLLRGAFVRMDDYGLDAVARAVLGEGKTFSGRGRADEILRLFEEDRRQLVEYNRTDARLALEILEKLRLVELAVERSRLTGLPLDRVASSIAAFDFLYLSALGRRRVVAPSVRTPSESVEPQAGGHVLEPLPGVYPNVVVLDFKSLYPSLIRTFEIDPLNLIRKEAGQRAEDPIVAPNGAAFARRKGLLSEILDELMPRREAARRAGDAVKSHAIKILMNSFYGVLGTPACRFFDPRLANAITGFGRELLLWCQARIEAAGRRVLYGDTDSLFVLTGAADAAEARAVGESLADELNRDLARHIAERWRVDEPSRSRLRPPVSPAVPAGRAPRHGRRAQALRGPRRGPRRRARRVHGHGGGARRLDRARQAGPARDCTRGCSATGPSSSTCARWSRSCAPAGTTSSSCTGSPCASHRRPTPPRRLRTWRRRARSPARRAAAWPTS